MWDWKMTGREGRVEELGGEFKVVGETEGTGPPVGTEGTEESEPVDKVLEGVDGKAGVGNDLVGALTEVPRGRMLRQFPDSPGRQCKQRDPLLTQEHLRHFAMPLQRQQREAAAGRRVEAGALGTSRIAFVDSPPIERDDCRKL